jgi:lipoprotein NlpD
LAEWNDIPPPYLIHEGQWLRVVSPRSEAEKEKLVAKSSSQLNDIERIKKKIVKRRSPVRHSVSKPRKAPRHIAKVEAVEVNNSGFDWKWPTKGELIKTFSNNSHGKKGIDISGKRGQRIVASAPGLVVYSGSGIIGLGNLVIIKHNKTFLSAYAHNDKLLVKEGEQVKQGQHIADMGDTGTERVLLHFEIRKNGRPVNPLRYLAKK